MLKGIIYYSDGKIEEPIRSAVQRSILKAKLPIVSCNLKPMNFGDTEIVPMLKPGFITYMTQIESALAVSNAEYVFFCEHDVLYPKCHFDFMPPKEEIYYYNERIWRWAYPRDFAITYDGLGSLSGLCAYTKTVLNHYRGRHKKIIENGWDKIIEKEPSWARKMGYEPGTKKIKQGGFSDEDFGVWFSDIPIIDIRHEGTYTRTKVTLDSFKHPPDPSTWKETTLDKIEGWNLKKEFNL